MKQSSKYVWGTALLIMGILWILSLLKIITFNVFFEGWWTLFIILPSLCGLINERDKTFPAIGMGIGIMLLLNAQQLFDAEVAVEMASAILVIILGLRLLFKRNTKSNTTSSTNALEPDAEHIHRCTVSFGEKHCSIDGETLQTLKVSVHVGAAEIDLRNAIITPTTTIDVDCSFCGIVLIIPNDIAVNDQLTTSLGGIEDKRTPSLSNSSNRITLVGNCRFAGIEIKSE